MSNGATNPDQSCSLGDKNDIEEVFRKFDANGDGKISQTELGAILRALGSETSPDDLNSAMTEIDTDGDGFIDLKEFAEFYSAGSDSDRNDKELRKAFDLYDQDKNGFISATELHSVLKSLGEHCSLNDCRKMIKSVDVDRDGSVNFEEFKKMMNRS